MKFLVEFLKNISIRKYPGVNLWNSSNQKYFKETGWKNSFNAKAPVDKNGNPQPWLSIAANKILDERLNADFKIYEFGSGNSTLYYSKLVQEVVSVEHHEIWFSKISNSMPSNVELVYKDLDSGEYESHVLAYENYFDLIIVDGRHRNKCALNAVKALKGGGVIIFDDFDREKYRPSLEALKNHDFKCLEFWGMAAGSVRFKSTAFFYKANNCLGI